MLFQTGKHFICWTKNKIFKKNIENQTVNGSHGLPRKKKQKKKLWKSMATSTIYSSKHHTHVGSRQQGDSLCYGIKLTSQPLHLKERVSKDTDIQCVPWYIIFLYTLINPGKCRKPSVLHCCYEMYVIVQMIVTKNAQT